MAVKRSHTVEDKAPCLPGNHLHYEAEDDDDDFPTVESLYQCPTDQLETFVARFQQKVKESDPKPISSDTPRSSPRRPAATATTTASGRSKRSQKSVPPPPQALALQALAGEELLQRQSKSREQASIPSSRTPPLSPDLGIAADKEYEVQRIVDERHTRHGLEYRVVWADTWVKAQDLSGAQNALRQFKANHYTHGRILRRRNAMTGLCPPANST